MAEFKDSATALIGDVDCTAEGESLCQEIGVEGYPTIKWGDPSDLQDYEGGRSLEDLKTFASTNLGPQCGPKNLDLCDAAKKAEIAKFSAMSAGDLEAFIQKGKAQIEELEAAFKAFVATLEAQVEAAGDKKDEIMPRLQEEYGTESTKKDAAVAAVKASGMGIAKAVKSFTTASNTEL